MERGVLNLDTTFAHHFLNLAIADRIRHIPAYAPQDHISLKMAPFEFNRLICPTEPAVGSYQAAAQRKFATEPDGARYVATSKPNTALREFPINRSHQRGEGYRMVKSAQFYSILQILTGDMEFEIVLY
jgi:hypothetical protein